MMTDDELMGIKKQDPHETKEIKVRIPVRLLVNLHYLKLTQNRPISGLVDEALEQYFASLSDPGNGLRSGGTRESSNARLK